MTFKPTLVLPTVDPFIRDLFARANDKEISLTDLAKRAGLDRNTVASWQMGVTPGVSNLQAALNAIGLKLEADRKVEMESKVPLASGLDPLVVLLFRRMAERRVRPDHLAEMIGATEFTVRKWSEGRQPRTDRLRAALQAVGVELRITPL